MIITLTITAVLITAVSYFVWKRFLKAEFDAFVIRDNERIQKELERRNKKVEFKEDALRAMYPLTPDECFEVPDSKNRFTQTEKEKLASLPLRSTSSKSSFDLPPYKEADLKQSLNDWCNRIVGDKPKGNLVSRIGDDYFFEKY